MPASPATHGIPTANGSSFLPLMLFIYALLFQAALVPLLFYLFPVSQPGLPPLTVETLAPRGLGDVLTIATYVVGLVAFAAARRMPMAWLRRTAQGRGVSLAAAGSNHPLSRVIGPYILRVCLFEICTVAGFVLAYLSHAPVAALPLAGLGLIGTLISFPSSGFFRRFGRGVG